MSILSSIPAFVIWLFWVLVAILLILLVAAIIHHFGGASLDLRIGFFHFIVGVRG
jgi:hypothetical protein